MNISDRADANGLTMLQPTNVLLVDDHPLVLESEGSTIAVMDQFLGVAEADVVIYGSVNQRSYLARKRSVPIFCG